ncbi:Hypothetical protein PFCIRM134_09015 [Propionibacterium freudenreichii]|nr:Hypothetical protein PFCIRM134_09015 [Propionibacterium freudenreichii]
MPATDSARFRPRASGTASVLAHDPKVVDAQPFKAGGGELVFQPNRSLPPPDAVLARAKQLRCSWFLQGSDRPAYSPKEA